MKEVVLVQGCRTAFGSFGGSLNNVSPIEMGTIVMQAVLERSAVSGAEVDHVFMGQVVATEPHDAYLSRLSSMRAGVSHEAPAMNINRLCGSGMQAIISAAQGILLGESNIALAGGVESASRIPYIATGQRWGARMGDSALVDMLAGVLINPFGLEHMGATGDEVAKVYGVSREDQDLLAYHSHVRARHAIEQGYFKEQIVPVSYREKGREHCFDQDEGVRFDISLEELAALRPAFRPEDGTVTAGNTLGLSDGAAALLLMCREEAHQRGLIPLAKLLSWGHAGVEPGLAGMGPVPATRIALKRAGLTVSDLDVVESNEAFAAQACAVVRELNLDPARVNPNGSGISLGHPFGATGAAITVKAAYELHRVQGRYALATMCLGGGQGIAVILERL